MSGFVDLQVNGYAGVDFNSDSLSEQQLCEASQRLRADGNDQILATIITAPLDKMIDRIGRLVRWIEGNRQISAMIAGIHVEGPFLNAAAGFAGAHPPEAMLDASIAAAQRLLDAGNGNIRFLTLAPERDHAGKVTAWLTEQGISVAAGHSDATIDQLRCGIDQGLKLFTHLGNGCPAKLNRHDNIIQRVLSVSDQLSVSFIADGHHVPVFALRNYLRCMPRERIVIVTDAIAAAGLGPGRYELSDQIVEVDEEGAAWSACRTHYAGCAFTFPQMVQVLKVQVGASDADIHQWLNVNPRRLLAPTLS